MTRLIGRYHNWIDIMSDVKREGLDAWKERNIPKAYALPEVPEGWTTPDDIEFRHDFTENDALSVIKDAGGGKYRVGGYEVWAAPLDKVEEIVKSIKAKRQYKNSPDDTRINMSEAVAWSGISRRTLDRYVEKLNIPTDQMFYKERCVRMIEPQHVIELAHYLCQHLPEYYCELLNSFLEEVSDPSFDIRGVKTKLRDTGSN